MSDELWVVRAGERAKYVDEFIAESYIAISFVDFASEDLSRADEAAVRARASSGAEKAYANQLVAFAYRMQVSDIVIVPRLASHRDYLVARIVGPYEYVPDAGASGPHRRTVEWLGRFKYEDMSQAATNTMGAILTIFRPTAVEPELRSLLTALAPLNQEPAEAPKPRPRRTATPADSTPVAVAPPARPLPQALLDINLDSKGRARITSGHPALLMEQTPRHVDPQEDWRGVPGIYVLTGTDVQQSLTRTGNERTLTATLIVKPWAYVGLSEDFLGRITSHRQNKPEWRRALLVRRDGRPFNSDDIKYLERRVHAALEETGEVLLTQTTPRGNLSARPSDTAMLDACADTVVAVLRLTGTLI
ncbi:hypothetical protein SAMN06893096_106260 [Geodermatophilus pulveris]|uniref:GIY-YIG nuclease family protein n=1 Tax=Geodermatophilus pulveris TaxID=1564159 RepID=A0A239GLU0_9ACTN|nr:hypothetical protein [Geodermatophilus pulveris]SNS69855.1 hypothetical protein SAMN06893096_106260 [Geodermatophilus pulveris]